jgi:hypothetical protein
MVRFRKLDCPVWWLPRTGPSFYLGLCLHLWDPVLLRYHLLWTLLCIMLRFVIGQSLAPQPCPPLPASWFISRGSILWSFSLVPTTRSCCCLWGNQTIWFGLVWHFRLSGFPILRSSCPTGGRHIRNGHLLRSSLYGQNPQQVLTIPSGSASAVTPMVCTTLPKEDKVDTSSAKAPMAQALVA